MHNHTQPTQINTQLYQICIQIFETFKLTLTTSKCTLVHLQCFKVSKPQTTPDAPTHVPIHLQHEAPQTFLQTLKTLKAQSLTN